MGVAQHYVKFPGFETVPSGLSAVTTPLGGGGVVVLLLLSGFLELSVWTQDPSKEVGDFGDPVGLGMYDTEMQNRELNNGRMAMFAALGIVAAELLTGKDGMQQLMLRQRTRIVGSMAMWRSPPSAAGCTRTMLIAMHS